MMNKLIPLNLQNNIVSNESKNDSKENNTVINIKKRGRKPKNYYSITSNDVQKNNDINLFINKNASGNQNIDVKISDNNDESNINDILVTENITTVKKRGRKATNKIIENDLLNMKSDNDIKNESIKEKNNNDPYYNDINNKNNDETHTYHKSNDIHQEFFETEKTDNNEINDEQNKTIDFTSFNNYFESKKNKSLKNRKINPLNTEDNYYDYKNSDVFIEKKINNDCNTCEKYKKENLELKNDLEILKKFLGINNVANLSSINSYKKANIFEISLTDNNYNIVNNSNIELNDEKKLCWWCCHSFEWSYYGLPDKIYNNTIHIYGYFCSLNCALSYNFDKNDNRVWERYSLINYIKNLIIGYDSPDIIKAPPRETLKSFGGFMTIEEFRKENITFEKDFKLVLSSVVQQNIYIEEKNVFMFSGDDKNIKIKRHNPVKSFNSLSKFIKTN